MRKPGRDLLRWAEIQSKSPLGIIALFIALAYAIAALVLGVGGAVLEPSQKWPLVWFLVTFPVLVLIVFAYLVVKHHTKLYAPRDFPDQEGFFRALSPGEQGKRLQREADGVAATQTRTAGKGAPKPPADTLELRSDVLLATELALRKMEAEFSTSIARNMATGPGLMFDGVVYDKGGRFYGIEVKYAKGVDWGALLDDFDALVEAKENWHVMRERDALLVIVADGPDEREVAAALVDAKAHLRRKKSRVILQAYSLDALRREFGIEGNDSK